MAWTKISPRGHRNVSDVFTISVGATTGSINIPKSFLRGLFPRMPSGADILLDEKSRIGLELKPDGDYAVQSYTSKRVKVYLPASIRNSMVRGTYICTAAYERENKIIGLTIPTGAFISDRVFANI